MVTTAWQVGSTSYSPTERAQTVAQSRATKSRAEDLARVDKENIRKRGPEQLGPGPLLHSSAWKENGLLGRRWPVMVPARPKPRRCRPMPVPTGPVYVPASLSSRGGQRGVITPPPPPVIPPLRRGYKPRLLPRPAVCWPSNVWLRIGLISPRDTELRRR